MGEGHIVGSGVFNLTEMLHGFYFVKIQGLDVEQPEYFIFPHSLEVPYF